MKYKLNKLDVKTTNNFKINDIEVNLDLPKDYNFDKFYTKDGVLESKIINKKIDSKVGLSFNKYLELIINVSESDDILVINYDFNTNNLIDKIVINYEENCSRNLIIKYNSSSDVFHHLFMEVNGKKNSNGNITIINNLSDKSKNFISINVNCLDNSNIVHNIIDLSGSVRVYNYYNELKNNSFGTLNNIYIGKDDNIIDMNYYMRHVGSNSISNISVEGILDNRALKNFRGTIDFISGSSKAVGNEYENVVLLSDKCISRSLPQMLCGEEDVEGNHGVSSGSISSDKLFYLESRGFSRKEAEKIIIFANFNRIINLIPDSDIQDEIRNIVELKI